MTKDDSKNGNGNKTDEPVDNSRRSFLKNSGIAAGGLVGGALLGGYFGNPFDETEPDTKTKDEQGDINYSETRQFFRRKDDFEILNAAVEQIYPEDDSGPGAIELGVPYFIDKQLASTWGRNADDYMKKPFLKGDWSPLDRGDIFIQGLRRMDEIAQEEDGEAFPDLSEDRQIEILEQFENNEVDMGSLSSGDFFGLLLDSTMAGCYSDPMYGGNKNMEGWKMKEYPGPRISYTDMVEEEDFVFLEPVSLKNQK